MFVFLARAISLGHARRSPIATHPSGLSTLTSNETQQQRG